MYDNMIGIQPFGLLKAIYTTPPGKPVHSETNSTSLGRTQLRWNFCATNIHSNFHRCLKPGTHLYSEENENAKYSKG